MSFDCQWSHGHNASSAHGQAQDATLTAEEWKAHRYDRTPIIVYSVVEKPFVMKSKDKEGNFQEIDMRSDAKFMEKASQKMEHAVLIDILDETTLVLDENDFAWKSSVMGTWTQTKHSSTISEWWHAIWMPSTNARMP